MNLYEECKCNDDDDDDDDNDDDDDDALFMAPYLVRTRSAYTDAGIHHFQQPHTPPPQPPPSHAP